MAEMQRRIQGTIDELVASGAEIGLQVAVYQGGAQVVDAVAGVADTTTGRAVTPETVFYSYSLGKGATASVVHRLAERGLFDYDTPIAELWPEFGSHGKARATIRHALTHTVGLPALPADVTPEDLCDWEAICARIAALEPWWEPGTKTAYHAYTFGYILGEVVRRATGTPISHVLRKEIGVPLGIAEEIYFGVPAAELHRLARLEEAPGNAEFYASLPDDSPFLAWAPRAVIANADLGNRPDILMADIPAGGKVSARAAARMYAALLGEVDGVRLISPGRLREAAAPAYSGTDAIMGNRADWALGYALGRPGVEPPGPPSAFGMAGAGGSYAYADTATGVAVAVTKTRLAFNFDAAERVAAIVAEEVVGR